MERSCTPRQCSAGTWQKSASLFFVLAASGCELLAVLDAKDDDGVDYCGGGIENCVYLLRRR